ncbi:MAG TPA: hypothetical protein VD835_01160 [Pyrinomonadaceae bacterium]|nr:hypothetical protein [Pyrinomonadaceae bacterium]
MRRITPVGLRRKVRAGDEKRLSSVGKLFGLRASRAGRTLADGHLLAPTSK